MDETYRHPYRSIATLVGMAGGLSGEEAQKRRSLEIAAEVKKRPRNKFRAGLQTLQMLSCCAFAPRPVSAELRFAFSEVLGIARHRIKRMFQVSLMHKTATEAAVELGIPKSTAYDWRKEMLDEETGELIDVDSVQSNYPDLVNLLDRFRNWRGNGYPPGLRERLYDEIARPAELGCAIEEPIVLLVLGEVLHVIRTDGELTQASNDALFGMRKPELQRETALQEGEALLAGMKVSTNASTKNAGVDRKTMRDWRKSEGFQLTQLAPTAFATFNKKRN